MNKWMNVCVMYMSGALSLKHNRMLQCANTKHGLLMVPVLVRPKRFIPSDVIYASKAQTVLQSLFVCKILLTRQNNCQDNNHYLLVASWTHRTWTVISITVLVITLPLLLETDTTRRKAKTSFVIHAHSHSFIILDKNRIVKECSWKSGNYLGSATCMY